MKLFIAKVDAKLLKRVASKYLKPINVKYANHVTIMVVLEHEVIASLHNIVKQSAIPREGVSE